MHTHQSSLNNSVEGKFQEEEEDLKYVTAGSNFSIDPAVPWNQVLGGLKDGLGGGRNNKKGAPKERENKQITEFKR